MLGTLLVLALNAAVFPAADACHDKDSEFMFEVLHFTLNAAVFQAAGFLHKSHSIHVD